jgi:hypothetical protein
MNPYGAICAPCALVFLRLILKGCQFSAIQGKPAGMDRGYARHTSTSAKPQDFQVNLQGDLCDTIPNVIIIREITFGYIVRLKGEKCLSFT